MSEVTEGARLDLGYRLLSEVGDEDFGDFEAKEPEGARVDPSYEVDYLIGINENEAPIFEMDPTIHEMLRKGALSRKIEFVRHTVWNRYWRPGRPLRIDVGQAVRVEKSTEDGVGIFPWAFGEEPRSYIGKKIKQEEIVRQMNRPIKTRLSG